MYPYRFNKRILESCIVASCVVTIDHMLDASVDPTLRPTTNCDWNPWTTSYQEAMACTSSMRFIGLHSIRSDRNIEVMEHLTVTKRPSTTAVSRLQRDHESPLSVRDRPLDIRSRSVGLESGSPPTCIPCYIRTSRGVSGMFTGSSEFLAPRTRTDVLDYGHPLKLFACTPGNLSSWPS